MIHALAILLSCQLAGELSARLLGLSLPGPVLGMLFLFAALRLRPALLETVRETSHGFLRWLSLLFVPAGVGLIRHGARIRAEAVPIVAAVVVSTLLTIAATALAFHFVAKAMRVER